MNKLIGVLVLLLASGCALKPAPITNPNLGMVGKVAVRAAQIVNAIDVAQRQIEPLVDAEVLTASEGLYVAKSFGTALEQAKAIVAILTLADAATTIAGQLNELSKAREAAKTLLRTVNGSTTGVAGLAGRIVVNSLVGSVTDAIADSGLQPAGVTP